MGYSFRKPQGLVSVERINLGIIKQGPKKGTYTKKANHSVNFFQPRY
jgi:hypothetical protein